MNFVFDVDGTLTPSRSPIEHHFSNWFLEFTKHKPVYLVSGSDYAKTLEQLGPDICESVKGVYSCAGNALYVKGEQLYAQELILTLDEQIFLQNLIDSSSYPVRTGNHLEMRIGLCNLSTVGRMATREQRKSYAEWDKEHNERYNLAERINKSLPRLEASVAGETGVDIYLRGKDKSQIVESVSPFIFFGDAIRPGGNDYTIALKSSHYHAVVDWQETFSLLKKYFREG
jgi:phosphomannomutase